MIFFQSGIKCEKKQAPFYFPLAVKDERRIQNYVLQLWKMLQVIITIFSLHYWFDFCSLLGKPLSLECIERTLHTSHSYSLEFTLHSAELVECLFDRRDGELGSMTFTADSDIKLPQYSEVCFCSVPSFHLSPLLSIQWSLSFRSCWVAW